MDADLTGKVRAAMAERFEVMNQVQTVSTTNVGRAVPVMRVSYRAKASGVEGSVDVPLDEYTAESVARAILARVELHDAVADL